MKEAAVMRHSEGKRFLVGLGARAKASCSDAYFSFTSAFAEYAKAGCSLKVESPPKQKEERDDEMEET